MPVPSFPAQFWLSRLAPVRRGTTVRGPGGQGRSAFRWLKFCGALLALGWLLLGFSATAQATTYSVSYNCVGDSAANNALPGDTVVITLSAACYLRSTSSTNSTFVVADTNGNVLVKSSFTQYPSGTVITVTVGATVYSKWAVFFSPTSGGTQQEVSGRSVGTPTVTSVTPATGPSTGATTITIGSTDCSFSAVSAVTIGGTAATSYTVSNTCSISAVTPAGTAGTANVAVTNLAGTSAVNTRFTYTPPVPTVTGVSPSVGSTAGGTSVTITGTNFISVTAVRFGTTAATSYTVDSTTAITAVSPAKSAAQYDITVTNGGGTSATSSASKFTYAAPPTATATTTARTFTVGTAITSFTPLTGSGGTGSLTYYVSSGTLPTGLALSSTTGAVTGTPTEGQSATAVVFAVKDSNNIPATTTSSVNITINKLSQTISFTSSAPTASVGGTTYTPTATATSGLGVSFSSTTAAVCTVSSGVVSFIAAGTCTVAADQSGSVAYNAASQVTQNVTVNAAPVASQLITSETLTKGRAASFTPVSGSGGTGSRSFSISPSLPDGLSISASTGLISGTASSASADTTYTVTVTDASGGTGTTTFSLAISDEVTTTQLISGDISLTPGEAITAFTPISASGGTGTLAYSVSPALPAGLSLDTATGEVSGTATIASALTSYTVTATDANGATATATFSLELPALTATLTGLGLSSTSVVFGTTAPTITAPTSESAGAITYSSGTASVATISGSTITLVGVGTTVITATQAAAGIYGAATTTISLTVTVATPVLSGLALSSSSVVFGTTAPTITAPTSASAGAITFSSGTTSVATISGSTISLVGIGSTVITATQAADGNYGPATTTITLTVTAATPVLSGLGLSSSSVVFGATAPTITAPTSASAGAITYSSGTTSVATISGSTISLVGVGSTVITATQAANGNYGSGTATITLTVTAATPSLSGLGLSAISVVFGATAPTITAPTSVSAGAITYASGTTSVATISGSTISIVGIGSTVITATQAADGNYTATTATITLTVTAATPVLSGLALSSSSVVFGSAAPTITDPTSASAGAITYSSGTPSVATISGSTISLVGVGTTIITATQAADGNYGAATATVTLTVTGITPVLSGLGLSSSSVIFGTTAPTITAPTSDSAGGITYSSGTPSVATISGSTISLVGIGTTVITATQAADGNYTGATATITLTVTAATPVLSGLGLSSSSVVFGATAPTITAPTSASAGAITYSSGTTSVATISGSTISLVGVGSTVITATQAANGNFGTATATITLTVTVGTPVLSGLGLSSSSVVFGTTAPTITAPTSPSAGAITYSSGTTSVATISGSTISIVGVGTTLITASQAAAGNYDTGSATITLTVTVATPVLSGFDLSSTSVAFGAAAPTIIAPSSPSAGVITFSSDTPSVASVSGSTLSIIGAGTTIITASQAADGNYGPATATVTLRVIGMTPTYSTSLTSGSMAFGAGPVTLDFTSDSPGAVTFTSSAPSVASISGSSLSIVGVGTTTITLFQAASGPYEAVTQTFTITITGDAPALAIQLGAASVALGSAAPSLGFTSASTGAVTFSSSVPGVATVSGSVITLVGAGTTVITASQVAAGRFEAATATATLTVTSGAPGLAAITPASGPASGGTAVTITGSNLTGATGVTIGGAAASAVTVVDDNTITARTPAGSQGSARVIVITPNGASTDTLVFAYALANPAKDRTVIGIVRAHANLAKQVWQTVSTSVLGRLEFLHEDDVPAFDNGVTLNFANLQDLSEEERQVFGRPTLESLLEPRAGRAAAFALPVGNRRPVLAASENEAAGASPMRAPGFRFWTDGTIVTGHIGTGSGAGAVKNRFTTTGLTAGADTRIAPGLTLGAALSLSFDGEKIDNSRSYSDGTAITGTAYGSWKVAPGLFVDAQLGYGGLDMVAGRYSATAPGGLRGERSGRVVFASLTTSYDQRQDGFTYAVFGGFDIMEGQLDAYEESGDASQALGYAALHLSSHGLILGVRGQYDMPLSWGTVSPTARLQFRRVLTGGATQSLYYRADPSTTYDMDLASFDQDALSTTLGLRIVMPDGFSGQIEYSNMTGMAGAVSNGLRLGLSAPF